ncbi:uncharacterized protein LOC143243673 [Tachypleus tridentatus]|uniref:uncharacterized protein LOC143243673 n=1 Tax=Tachypleus tridentatus TaxID=6853 RepID=UPI003FD3B704
MMRFYLISCLVVTTLALPAKETPDANLNVFPTEDEEIRNVPTIYEGGEISLEEKWGPPEGEDNTLENEDVSEEGEEEDPLEGGDLNTYFQPVSLPTDFESYDRDGNGYIEHFEFVKMSDTAEEKTFKLFSDADTNEDGFISPLEFQLAPWNLLGEPLVTPGNQLHEKDYEFFLLGDDFIDSAINEPNIHPVKVAYEIDDQEEEPSSLDVKQNLEVPYMNRDDDPYDPNEKDFYQLHSVVKKTGLQALEDEDEEKRSSSSYENYQWMKLNPLEGYEFVDDELRPVNE